MLRASSGVSAARLLLKLFFCASRDCLRIFALGLAVAAENVYLDDQLGTRSRTDYVPGMVGIDPLGMDGPATRTGEIWGGRVAMVAVVIYALEEAVTKAPLIIAPGF